MGRYIKDLGHPSLIARGTWQEFLPTSVNDRRLPLLGPGLGLTLAGLTNYHSAALREGLTACLQAVSNSKHYTSIRRAHRLQPEGHGPPTATT
jgi:hypothetical protein